MAREPHASTRARRAPGDGGYAWQVTAPATARLDLVLSEHVGRLEVEERTRGTAVLRGELPDLPAVYGLVLRLRDAGTQLHALHVEHHRPAQRDDVVSEGNRRREGGTG